MATMLKMLPCVCGNEPELKRDTTSSVIHPFYVGCTCGRRGIDSFRENGAIYNWNKIMEDYPKCPKCGSPDTYQDIKYKSIIECGECGHRLVVTNG